MSIQHPGGLHRSAPSEAAGTLPSWPVTAMIAGLPVWFLLGLAGFSWVLFALPMVAALARRRDLMAPRGAGLWLLFMVAVVGSVMSIDGLPRFSGWLLRLGYYVAASVFGLYVLNGGDGLPMWKVVRAFAILWLATVAGGYLAFVLGDLGYRSPMAYVVPRAFASNELVATMVRPSFADLQDIIGFPVPRPKAPFPYTNSWGSMLALLTPFGLIAVRNAREIGLPPNLLRLALYASVLPAVISLNRGLWLSLGLGLCSGAVRLGLGGQSRALRNLIVAAVIGVVFLALTPLGGLVERRIETGHSDADRFELVADAVEGAQERPLFGWGGPRPNDRDLPSVGTHGQAWFVLFSYGFVGAAGYFGALVTMAWHTRRQASVEGLWAHVVIVIGLIQAPFYLHVPHQMFTVLAAAALAVRLQQRPSIARPRATGGRRRPDPSRVEDRRFVQR
jgi:polysaccharide biosynthesis protein PslJ